MRSRCSSCPACPPLLASSTVCWAAASWPVASCCWAASPASANPRCCSKWPSTSRGARSCMCRARRARRSSRCAQPASPTGRPRTATCSPRPAPRRSSSIRRHWPPTSSLWTPSRRCRAVCWTLPRVPSPSSRSAPPSSSIWPRPRAFRCFSSATSPRRARSPAPRFWSISWIRCSSLRATSITAIVLCAASRTVSVPPPRWASSR